MNKTLKLILISVSVLLVISIYVIAVANDDVFVRVVAHKDMSSWLEHEKWCEKYESGTYYNGLSTGYVKYSNNINIKTRTEYYHYTITNCDVSIKGEIVQVKGEVLYDRGTALPEKEMPVQILVILQDNKGNVLNNYKTVTVGTVVTVDPYKPTPEEKIQKIPFNIQTRIE